MYYNSYDNYNLINNYVGPSAEVLIPLFVSIDTSSNRYITSLTIDVSTVLHVHDSSIDRFVSTLQLSQVINCVDPLLNVTLMDDTLMDDRQGISIFNNIHVVNDTVTLEDIFTVSEDQHYTVSVSLTIINGSYTVTNTTSFSE